MEKWKIQKYYYVSKKTYDRLQWYACTKSVNEHLQWFCVDSVGRFYACWQQIGTDRRCSLTGLEGTEIGLRHPFGWMCWYKTRDSSISLYIWFNL